MGLLKNRFIRLKPSISMGTELKSVGLGEDSIKGRITDSRDATIETISDLSGYIVKTKDANGNITSIERDLDGKPVKIKKPNGSITQITYDSQTGDVLSSTETTLGTYYTGLLMQPCAGVVSMMATTQESMR